MTTPDSDGASPRELLIEACRRNNTSLLNEVLSFPTLASTPASVAKFLNTTTDALGQTALHIAAQYGSYEVLDLILDQEGVEIDGQERRDGDTCLHKAVRFCNGGAEDGESGRAVVEILVDAGCDPRYVSTFMSGIYRRGDLLTARRVVVVGYATKPNYGRSISSTRGTRSYGPHCRRPRWPCWLEAMSWSRTTLTSGVTVPGRRATSGLDPSSLVKSGRSVLVMVKGVGCRVPRHA